MKYIKENVDKEGLQRINNALIKFDKFLTGLPETDEHIGIYEHWIDCMYDTQKVIIREDQKNNCFQSEVISAPISFRRG